MRHRGFVIAVLMALAAAHLAAEDRTADKAAEVLAAARGAIGGTALDALHTFSIEGVVQRNVGSMQLTSDVEILLDLPGKYLRTDTPRGGPGVGAAVGFTADSVIRPAGAAALAGGGMVIRIGPGGPAPAGKPLSPEDQARADAAMRRSLQTDASRLMLGWFAMVHPSLDATYGYVGEAESPDGKAHVVEAADAGGFTARLFVDQATNLPLMVTYHAAPPRIVTMERGRGEDPAAVRRGGRALSDEEREKLREDAEQRMAAMQKEPPVMVEHTLYFDDWRETGGVKFPHSIRRAADGMTNEEWTITRVRLNPRLDARKFQS